MLSSSVFKLLLAAIVLLTASAFIPVTNGPTLDQKQGKIAGIGGLEGPKPPTSGGIGSFKVGSNSKAAPKKETPKKQVVAKKTNNNKKAPVEEKKKTNLWIKTPWSK
ncbi:hypothetical protein ACHAWO_007844 [Cyclotella atomus]|uniref:Secreted protein n=1 Tax=Cyclotella atomus TaxID=382360 RepID=A0ABD3NKX2_9STRA